MVPSITEMLFDLGLGERVVGITKFCVYPEAWFRTKKRIGGTKNVKLEEVLGLSPDLVIANREENVAEQVLEIAKSTNTWLTDIKTFEDALQMIRELGEITGCVAAAQKMADAIHLGFGSLPKLYRDMKTVYLIWERPCMTVGGDTFIHHMMERVGLKNTFGHLDRYPEIDLQKLQEDPPGLLLLSSEPFPFGPKHLAEWKALLPETMVELVDGTYFSWYGSRLVQAPGYFAKCISTWNQTS